MKLSKKYLIFWSIICILAGASLSAILINMVSAHAEIRPQVPGSFSPLVKSVRDSVVNISTVKVIKGTGIFQFKSPFGPGDPFHDFFERFFGNQIPREYRQKSLGTGFIIDKEGYILTNNHVVEKTDEIKVRLSNDKEYKAKIVGRDPKTDLALIKIKADESLKPLPLGDSDKLEVGDWVIAIGNPFGLGHTVTAGIVSAKYRHLGMGSYENFIQTDASINPGNSGGPLLDMNGKVVGINTAIFTQSGGSIGIGFAIPINMAKSLLPQLKKGKVIRGWLGVMIQKITPELMEKLGLKSTAGALVADVTKGGPADKAGIKRGDVIIRYNGRLIREMNELPFLVASTPVGKIVDVEVLRKGKKRVFKVKIGKLQEKEQKEAMAEKTVKLGMRVEEINPELRQRFGITEKKGVVVVDVDRFSPAYEAGIRKGDIILEIDQKPVKDLNDYVKMINKYKKGDTILFLIKRGGNTIYLTLKVEK